MPREWIGAGTTKNRKYTAHSLMSPPTPPHADSSASSSPRSPHNSLSLDSSSLHNCQWLDCPKSFPNPETLYNHLCNDHIGRKSTNNLCLTCKWKDCVTTCTKRDHITSHLRGLVLLLSPRSTMFLSRFHSPHTPQTSCMRCQSFMSPDPRGRPHHIFRSVKKPSNARKISRSTRKYIQKSITLSTSTPRPSPFPMLCTPDIAASR